MSHSEENYLKAIWKLVAKNGEPVSTNDIAAIVSTKAASVTDMLKKLSEKKLIRYKPYRGVSLTGKGFSVAIEVVRKHRLWEVFLVEQLGYKWDEVHDIAEQLEHIHSSSLTEKLDAYLGFPKTDPHGDLIPDSEGKFPDNRSVLLSELRAGDKGVVTGVTEDNPVFLRHLDKTGTRIGSAFEIKNIVEYDRSIVVRINRKKIHMSPQITKNILVKKTRSASR
ncbi:MAG: metal-dependent transcriptional regulator [Bacteroidetes bacterium]|nr:metal-dependent transcriptional regulator [Bacteroidota bacterium]